LDKLVKVIYISFSPPTLFKYLYDFKDALNIIFLTQNDLGGVKVA